jgi:hypothetical protein
MLLNNSLKRVVSQVQALAMYNGTNTLYHGCKVQARKEPKMIQTLSTEKTTIAVITGGHSYEVIAFHQLFRSLPDVCAYIQSLDEFCSSSQADRLTYDALVFYNFHQDTPEDEQCPWYAGKQRTVLDEVLGNGQGMVFLHHALLAYPNWDAWTQLLGIAQRSFQYFPDQEMMIYPAEAPHCITEGLQPWQMVDEVYLMDEPQGDVEVLLTTDHPRSMQSIAWVRELPEKRVFCLVSGHDARTWQNESFQQVLLRGIQWAAKTLST